MNYEDLKAEILPRWEEILQKITSPAKSKVNGHISYICPLCGHGAHGDGLTINARSSKSGLKCFGCNFSGDILELLKRAEGLESFSEQIERASYLLGINTEDISTPPKVAQKKDKNEHLQSRTTKGGSTSTNMSIHTNTQQSEDEEEKKCREYYLECVKRLDRTDYLTSRGISKETAQKLGLGYDPEAHPKKGAKWKALIIPISKTSYVYRNTDPKADSSNRYAKRGASSLYRTRVLKEATAPIFVVEGELDAISIYEVGGFAIGLGSADNKNKFIDFMKTQPKPSQPLILALDNDEAGRTASEFIASELSKLKIPYHVVNIFGDCKDANEALLKDRETFTSEVLEVAERIEREEAEKLRAERAEYLNKETAYGHLKEFLDGIDESIRTPATPTGFELLDDILDGGLYEGLYCLGAITSLGKTTFVLQLADQIAREHKDVLIFSLEMSRAELMSKSISRLTYLEALRREGNSKQATTARGITAGKKYEKYSKAKTDIIIDAVKNYGNEYSKNIYIHEGLSDIGVLEIRERVEKHIRLTGRTPIIIIDYLQILSPYNEEYIKASDKQNTDKNVVELKRISRDFKTSIIGISSFNRDNYTAPVNLTSFKESGAIEYSSDVLIGLQYLGMDYEKGEPQTARDKRIRELIKDNEARGRSGGAQTIQLKVLKNRYGAKGDVILDFFPMFNYFKENLEANIEDTSPKKKPL